MVKRFDRVCIVAVNASYSHSSLSLRCLSKSLDGVEVCTHEYTINDIRSKVAAELYKEHCGLYAFSCYIWNIEFVLDVCEILKAALPECKILLGGPEVSYDAPAVLCENKCADYVMCGEGEIALNDFVNGGPLEDISGLTYRKNGKIVQNPVCIIEDLDALPRLYTADELDLFKNKIVYYETSRGCPYRCSYCLSSTSHGVRFYSLQRVCEDFMMFMNCGVKLVKLVDRTFNVDRVRTKKLLRFILEHNRCTCFHFEVSADILDDETIELFRGAPKGFFQLEIGVQSTNERTLASISRNADMAMLKRNIQRLLAPRNMHIHLDLIAGLPYEDYASFKRSFDEVFSLRPNMLQLGFLKLLKGTAIRSEADKYDYRFNPKPTYEVISNDFISYDEILALKGISAVVERYYNSASFEKSIETALRFYESKFGFFDAFSRFWQYEHCDKQPQSKKALYDIFFRFYTEHIGRETELFRDCLKFDFIRNNKNSALPYWADRTGDKAFYSSAYEFLRSDNGKKYIPGYEGAKQSEIARVFKVEKFKFDICGNNKFGECVIIFDYEKNSFTKIEGKF